MIDYLRIRTGINRGHDFRSNLIVFRYQFFSARLIVKPLISKSAKCRQFIAVIGFVLGSAYRRCYKASGTLRSAYGRRSNPIFIKCVQFFDGIRMSICSGAPQQFSCFCQVDLQSAGACSVVAPLP